MAMSITEGERLRALEEKVAAINGDSLGDLFAIRAAIDDLTARLNAIEQRSKPGPKPKAKQ